jgi:flagellar motor switch protein FliN/FliY
MEVNRAMKQIDEDNEIVNQESPHIDHNQKVEAQIDLSDLKDEKSNKVASNIDFLLDIPLEITIELGRTKILINELLKLGQGSVIELEKIAGETMDIFANQKLIAKGEVVVINEKYGVRLTEIISPVERIARLK